MESIRDVFITGYGPSSSHTIAPGRAVSYLLNKYPHIEKAVVTLYGSLALTGKGHGTDAIIQKVFGDVPCEVIANLTEEKPFINTMEFVLTVDGKEIRETILSTGGGSIKTSEDEGKEPIDVYPCHTLHDILRECIDRNIDLGQYVIEKEGKSILSYMEEILLTMENNVKNGFQKDGYLPGPFQIKRRARDLYLTAKKKKKTNQYLVMASAIAVSEENASGEIVATAPTCGSCGVIPGAVAFLQKAKIERNKIIEGLAVAGLIGKIIKTNATVSGAVGGCQAEIGSACAMAAAMIAHCQGQSVLSVAQAAEIALEHSLGLTCDPLGGYVLIPCIERNAIFAIKAISSATLASLTNPKDSKIHFDDIVETMYQTGLDMNQGYKETSTKGIAKLNIC